MEYKIYKIELEDKVVYVGQTSMPTILDRFNRMGFDQSLIAKKMREHGKDNFKISLIEECEGNEADDKERYYIAKMNPPFNRDSGGRRGYKHPPSFAKRMTEVHKGKIFTESSKVKMRKSKPCKPVICLETKNIYCSYRVAADRLGIDKGSVHQALKGLRKKAGGYTFGYCLNNTKERIEYASRDFLK